jgi:hypothetical protein
MRAAQNYVRRYGERPEETMEKALGAANGGLNVLAGIGTGAVGEFAELGVPSGGRSSASKPVVSRSSFSRV